MTFKTLNIKITNLLYVTMSLHSLKQNILFYYDQHYILVYILNIYGTYFIH